MASDGCAIGTDGNLLDASDIAWFNDADDDTPIAPPTTHSTGQPQLSVTTLDSFVTSTPLPTRRSNRTARPSTKAIDPDNAMAIKRKSSDAANPNPSRRLRRASPEYEEDNTTEPGASETDAGTVTTQPNSTDTEEDDSVDLDKAYTETKALGDADRKAMRIKSKDQRTADIRTIFMKTTDYVHPGSGKMATGHYCLVCKDKGLSTKAYFFSGGVSSLRAHIARNKDHFEIYKAKCNEHNLSINKRAIPMSELGPGLERQATLDGSVTRQPRTPPFTSQGLIDHLVELVVSEDEAFHLVDKPTFRQLILYLRPTLTDKDIPHRTKFREEVLVRAVQGESKLKAALQGVEGEISFTFDTWTSESGHPYISVTAHYIDSPKDRPDQWVLREGQLAFAPLEGDHTGANIASIVANVLDRYNIREKAGWFTTDNASNNDTAMKELKHYIDPNGDRWDPVQRRVRCMEHSLHLAAAHFLSHITPTQTRKAHEGGNDNEDNSSEDEDVYNDSNAITAEALRKLLGLIKQIRKSPQARKFFKQLCHEVKLPELELVLFVRTRWSSMFVCLERALNLRKAVKRFIKLADDSKAVPNLRNKKYSDFYLSKFEWERLELLQEVLQEPASAQQSFSKSREPTVWHTIPLLEFLQQTWENMAATSKFEELAKAIHNGLANVHKWYHKIDDTDVYFICLALNPTWKLAYTERMWSKVSYKAGLERLYLVFDCYVTRFPQMPTTTELAPSAMDNDKPIVAAYGHSWMLRTVGERKAADRSKAGARDELKSYLEAPLLETPTDVIAWWGKHSTQYPVLSRMARDYLAIQGSATPSERAFSNASLTDDKQRNRLAPEMFEALQNLKSAYRNGHMSATGEAQSHYRNVMGGWPEDVIDVDK